MIMAITFLNPSEEFSDQHLEDFEKGRKEFKFVVSESEMNDFVEVATDFGFNMEVGTNTLRIVNLFDASHKSLPLEVYQDYGKLGMYAHKAFTSANAFNKAVIQERWRKLASANCQAVAAG